MTDETDQRMKARSKALWNAGDYTPTSRQLAPASEALAESMGIAPGQSVLDVAAGHGNCAIAAARRGATVVAADFAPTMITVGRARTDESGLPIRWEEADVANLPFEDGSFDRVMSVFGLIFAPEQQKAAAEVMRVLRPGGTAGITAWTKDSFVARMLEVPRELGYGPPRSPDAPDSLWWGEPDVARSLLGAAGAAVELRERTVRFRYRSWDEWRASFEAHGMAVMLRQDMPPETYEAVLRGLQALTAEHDVGEGDTVAVDAHYLEILGRKPVP